MKIPKSSSMILATLAVSSSTPSLAAPTGDPSTGDVSSPHASRRSSVSYPSQDVERRDNPLSTLCPVNSLLDPVLQLFPAVEDKLNDIFGCTQPGTVSTEKLMQLDSLGKTLSDISQSALAGQNPVSNSDSLSPSPTPTVPPNSPNVSAQPTNSSTVQQRDALFARRGVAAPPQPPAQPPVSSPHPAVSPPANVQSQAAASPAPANIQPPSAPAAVPQPSAPATVSQPSVRRAWSSRALPQAPAPQAPAPAPAPAVASQSQVPAGVLRAPQAPVGVPAGGPQQAAAAVSGAPKPPVPTSAPVAPPQVPAPAPVLREVDGEEDCDE